VKTIWPTHGLNRATCCAGVALSTHSDQHDEKWRIIDIIKSFQGLLLLPKTLAAQKSQKHVKVSICVDLIRPPEQYLNIPTCTTTMFRAEFLIPWGLLLQQLPLPLDPLVPNDIDIRFRAHNGRFPAPAVDVAPFYDSETWGGRHSVTLKNGGMEYTSSNGPE
jgi:hypothetical protein